MCHVYSFFAVIIMCSILSHNFIIANKTISPLSDNNFIHNHSWLKAVGCQVAIMLLGVIWFGEALGGHVRPLVPELKVPRMV